MAHENRHDTTPDTQGQAGPDRGPAKTGGRWSTRLALVAVLLLVGAPIVYNQTPREVSRWYRAAATEHYLDGNLEAARQSLDKALEWSPDNGDVHLIRSAWEREAGNYSAALEACERAEQALGPSARVYLERSQVYHHLGRWDDSLADWKKLSEEVDGASSNPVVLNGLAYARALANKELAEGLADIERAIERQGPNAAMLDTRGYLHYRLGDFAAARKDVDQAVELQEKELATASDEASQVDRAAADARFVKRIQQERHRSLAVLRYHRLLVLEKQGETEAAEQERAKIKELGFEANEQLF